MNGATPKITPAELKVVLEEVLAEQKDEQDKAALQNAVESAATVSGEALEIARGNAETIKKSCEGVECLREAISDISKTLDGFTAAIEAEGPAPTAPTAQPTPPAEASPVQQPQGPVPPGAVVSRVVPPVQEPVQEHHHDHPDHLSSPEMAEGVLERIMACDQCSPSMREALKRRLHKYLPNYRGREEATGGEERREAEKAEEAVDAIVESSTEGAGQPAQVAGGEESGEAATAKGEPEAGVGAPGDAPTAAAEESLVTGGDSTNGEPPANNAPAPVPANGDAAKALDERKKDRRDPLGWI